MLSLMSQKKPTKRERKFSFSFQFCLSKSKRTVRHLCLKIMPSITFLKSLTINPSRLKTFLFILSLSLVLYVFFYPHPPPPPLIPRASDSPLTRRHVLFAIASSSNSFPRRKPYLRLWYSPNSTRAFAFLDRAVDVDGDETVPPVVVSGDTSRFPYTFRGGLRSAIRVARVVKEVVDRGEEGVRWYVFGDDDTVFFVDNLVKTLAKYDHDRWFYIGAIRRVTSRI